MKSFQMHSGVMAMVCGLGAIVILVTSVLPGQDTFIALGVALVLSNVGVIFAILSK